MGDSRCGGMVISRVGGIDAAGGDPGIQAAGGAD
jgi:hypothetical protein